MLSVNFHNHGDVVVLGLEGDINVDASNFVEAVGLALARGYKKIVCNFSEINLVDYVGVSLIAVAYKNVINHKAEMLICGVPAHVARIFAVVGLDRVFESFSGEDQALKNLQNERRITRVLSRKFRRRFKRIGVRGTVEYRSKNSFSDTFHTGGIVNLSAIGVFALVEHVFPIGEIVTTRLISEDLTLELDTRVVWIADSEMQQLKSAAMGLEFYHIDADKQKQIVDFVEKHLARSH